MPNEDRYHSVILRSLKKAGWSIIKEQEYISIGTSNDTNRRLYIDVKAQRYDAQLVLIEIKGLERSRGNYQMDTGNLKQILAEEMQKYAGQGLNAYSYLTENEAEQLYTVVDIANVRGKRIIGTVLVARLQDEKILIELDYNNKPLADALAARGVSEEQIILAYLDTTISA